MLVVVASVLASVPSTAQVLSARPASISLTVVVPPRPESNDVVPAEGWVALLAVTRNAIDFETSVGLSSRIATRTEVRLAPRWGAHSGRVWVRNRRGDLEPLTAGGPAVVVDAPNAASPLRVRVEGSRALDASSLTIPLEYRMKVGAGDEFSVWTFSSLVRITPAPTRRDGGS